ncbi:MAG: hypothetical protein R3C26_12025 [Calditrichia bacterium]
MASARTVCTAVVALALVANERLRLRHRNAGGNLAAIAQRIWLPDVPEYWQFLLVSGIALFEPSPVRLPPQN